MPDDLAASIGAAFRQSETFLFGDAPPMRTLSVELPADVVAFITNQAAARRITPAELVTRWIRPYMHSMRRRPSRHFLRKLREHGLLPPER